MRLRKCVGPSTGVNLARPPPHLLRAPAERGEGMIRRLRRWFPPAGHPIAVKEPCCLKRSVVGTQHVDTLRAGVK